MKIPTTISVKHLWGGAVFQREDWGAVTYLVGPNGTGKTSFADQLKAGWFRRLRPRYLSADRLAGLDRAPFSTKVTTNPLQEGMNIGDAGEFRKHGEHYGYAVDAWLTLRAKLDVRLRVEAFLSRMFGRSLRLAEEGGFLKPKLQHAKSGSAEYEMREAECHGLKELMALLAFLYDDSYNCLILDEPELHLHPQFQQFVLSEIKKVAGNPIEEPGKKCFVLITHSPYMLDIRTLDDLGNLIVFQPDRLPSSVGELDENDKYRIRKALPRLNTHHKQFFFATRPVFVEGYTDQQFLSLLQEQRGRPIAAGGVSIIDVGGKEEVDTFYRLCERMNVKAQAIVDFDAIFAGQLRGTVSASPEARRYLQEEGLGPDLMQVFRGLLQPLDEIARAAAAAEAAVVQASNELSQFVSSIRAESDLEKRRRLAFLAVQRARVELERHFPEQRENIAFVFGRTSKLLKAFACARVHVLPAGELENYFPSYEENPYSISDTQKQKVFLAERDHLLAGGSVAEIETRYARILPLIDEACGSVEVDVAAFVLAALGDWVHNVQTAFRLKQLTDLGTLKSAVRVQWATYERVISIESFSVESPDAFRCVVRLLPSVDSQERYVSFSHDTVAAGIHLSATPSGF